MKKIADEVEELREKLEAIERDKQSNASYWQGVKDSLKKAFWVCGLAWTGISLAVNNYGEYAYKHVPVIRRIVDAINGGGNG